MEQKFYVCEICGNLVAKVKVNDVPIMCCGKVMQEIIPGTSDASQEKHVPKYQVNGNEVVVTVGEVIHPMSEEHFIEWVSLQTKQGNQRKMLQPQNEPKISFLIYEDDEVEAVYAYCNLHGLWKA